MLCFSDDHKTYYTTVTTVVVKLSHCNLSPLLISAFKIPAEIYYF